MRQGAGAGRGYGLANTALDLLGQARLWLSYAGEIEAAGRDEDTLAYLRGDRDFYNCLLVEQPNGNYADTMMRQSSSTRGITWRLFNWRGRPIRGLPKSR
jgi:ring-1,2-phenylacetyl-CoA epoxidase subunit PaaC